MFILKLIIINFLNLDAPIEMYNYNNLFVFLYCCKDESNSLSYKQVRSILKSELRKNKIDEIFNAIQIINERYRVFDLERTKDGLFFIKNETNEPKISIRNGILKLSRTNREKTNMSKLMLGLIISIKRNYAKSRNKWKEVVVNVELQHIYNILKLSTTNKTLTRRVVEKILDEYKEHNIVKSYNIDKKIVKIKF